MIPMRRLAVVLILFLNCPLFAQQGDRQPRLAVSIRSLKTIYRMSDRIQLEIQLLNVGRDTFVINHNLNWGVGRTDAQTFDSRGKQIFTSFFADEVPPTPKRDDFLELRPNVFFGVRLDELVARFVNAPGTYELAVDYTSTDSEQWTRQYLKLPNPPLWSRERGTVSSGRIKITVEK